MTYSLITHTFFAGAANGGTTPAVNTTGADLIVVGVPYQGTISTPTDSQGNAYIGLTAQETTHNIKVRMYYCQAPSTNTSHTFSSTGGSSNFEGIYVGVFSGSRPSPFDVENGNLNSSGNSSIQTGSITPSEDNELIIVAACDGSTSAQSIDSGMTILDSHIFTGGSNLGGGLAYKIQTTAAAIDPTWTNPGSGASAVVIASFKAPGPANIDLPATSATGAAATFSITTTASSSVTLTAVSGSGSGAALSVTGNGNVTLTAVSAASAQESITPTPGSVLGSVSASGSASDFTQNGTFNLVSASAQGIARSFSLSTQIVSLSCIGRMRNTLPIDAIASNKPLAANGTIRNTPVPAIGSLLAA